MRGRQHAKLVLTWALAVVGVSLAVACGGGRQSRGAQPTGAPATPAANASATVVDHMLRTARAQVMLFEWEGQGGKLRPIGPETGEDLPGYEPIEYGTAVFTQISPDGRWAAIASHPASDPASALSSPSLHLLDLVAWKDREIKIRPLPSYTPMAWSHDSNQVYFISGLVWYQRQLWVFDVTGGDARLVAELGAASIRELVLSRDDRVAFVFGAKVTEGATARADDDSFVAAVDTATGHAAGRVALPGVLAGSYQEGGTGSEYTAYTPAFAVAPDGSRAYVLDSGSDRVTVIDLAAMKVERTADVVARRSRLERLEDAVEGLFVSKAEAKGGPNSRKEALISLDGRWLYVTGSRTEPCDGQQRGCYRDVPLGLTVVDTRTLRKVLSYPGVTSVDLTPDGLLLLARSVVQVRDAQGMERPGGDSLLLFDAREPAFIARIGPARMYSQVATDDSGRWAHLLSTEPSSGIYKPDGTWCGSPCWTYSVVDLEQRTVVEKRVFHSVGLTLVGRPRP